ncbi:hypothetical protein CCACVL1_00339 [Corchorus capsularis]|uniref:Uncharacterized protein n=1 Tax=Corchorus capsularis TaxID=210143 RepID=A0A1R3KXE6_COCAP|nr:hypothetical protein CCACVL1_00339 [Corchorus capsularis]
MMQMQMPMQPDNYHHLSMGMGMGMGMGSMGMGRNYAELAELSRVLRGGPSSASSTASAVNLPIQSQINYPGGGGGGGGFTISGLNLNLGGGSTQGVMRPIQPPPPHDAMTTAPSFAAAENGYAPDQMNTANGPSNRYLSMDHCMDLDTYWPTTY